MKKIIIVVAFLSFLSCDTYRPICNGVKSDRRVYRNVNNIYPVYTKTFDTSLKGVLKLLSEAVSEDISLKTEIEPLREKLSSSDALIQDLLKSRYLVVQGNPCDKSSWDNFNSALDELSENVFALENLKIKYSNLEKIEETKGEISDQIKILIADFESNYNFKIQ